jgi:hypothetical protein
MGQGQSGRLPSKQGGIGDRKGNANNKKEKKYEPAALPTRVGKKQRKQKGPEAEGTRSSRSLARGSRLPPSASFGFLSWIT